jgi:hypothetical protein
MDKEVLIRKNLEELYGGKPKGFKLLFKSMFVGQVRKAVGGLQREVKAATDYLQSKVRQAVVERPAKEEQPTLEEKPAAEEKLVGEKPGLPEVTEVSPSGLQ